MSKVFLIGAGATRAQYPKAPLSNDFFKLLNAQDSALFDSIFTSISSSIAGKNLLRENVEDIMDLSYNFCSSNRTSFLENIYIAIFKLLAGSTNSTADYMRAYIDGQIAVPPTLIKTLLNNELLDESSFFLNLNYDLYLDREVMAINSKTIDYGLDSEVIASTRRIITQNHKKFSVYHLHGALNWRFIPKDEKVALELGAITPTYGRDGSNLCLIAPGMKNPMDNPVLKKIWKVATMRLLGADELVVIGCSLNPKDVDLINMVKHFAKNKGVDKIKIITTKNSASIENYRNLLGDGFKLYEHGFNLNGEEGKLGSIEFIFS